MVEKKFSTLKILNIYRVSQNKENTQISWLGIFKVKEILSHDTDLNCRLKGLVGAEGDQSPPPLCWPFFCVTALAVPTGFTQPHLAAFPSTLFHISTTRPSYRSALFPGLPMGYGQSPCHPHTCLWKCESFPDCEMSLYSENPPCPELPMFGGSGEASPQHPPLAFGNIHRVSEK